MFNKWVILFFMFVLFAILKVLVFFITSVEKVKRVISQEIKNDIIKIKIKFCNNVKINVHVLKT